VIEASSALARLHRQQLLSNSQYRSARERLAMLSAAWREIQPSVQVRELAERQLDRHDLRAADAFQLAAALIWCNERPRNRPFLCRDIRLREAARHEGFSIVEL
jgi:predicted nucleic acid-binding protein